LIRITLTAIVALAALTLPFNGGASAAPAAADSSKGGDSLTAQGLVEVGISGELDIDPGQHTQGPLDLQLGYFMFEGIEAGGVFTFGKHPGSGYRDAMGLFAEYNFSQLYSLLPYAGGQGKYAKTTGDVGEGNARLLSFYGGFKLQVASHVALTMQVTLESADKSVFNDEDSRKKTNTKLTLGYRIFF
jgi:hypothetical protein